MALYFIVLVPRPAAAAMRYLQCVPPRGQLIHISLSFRGRWCILLLLLPCELRAPVNPAFSQRPPPGFASDPVSGPLSFQGDVTTLSAINLRWRGQLWRFRREFLSRSKGIPSGEGGPIPYPLPLSACQPVCLPFLKIDCPLHLSFLLTRLSVLPQRTS